MKPVLFPACLAAVTAGLLIAAAVSPDLFRPTPLHRVEDFGLYWSAARVHLLGGNPYDPAALEPYQAAIEPDRAGPQLPWGPPWSLGLLEPFAAVGFPAARLAWGAFGLALLLASASAAWRLAGGSPDRVTWAWLLAVIFYPSLLGTALGQQSVFALAGVAGFLAALDRKRPAVAGACLALTLAKPQNLILLWAAVVSLAILGRRWRLLAGLLAGCVGLTAVTLIPNAGVFGQYVHAMTHYPPRGWPTLTAGTLLRMGLGIPQMWPAFVVTATGFIWLAWHLTRRARSWDWNEDVSPVLFAGFLTTPYGWAYDQVVLVIPLLQAAAVADRRGGRVWAAFLVGHVGLTLFCVVLNRLKTPEWTFVWLAPVFLMCWLCLRPNRGQLPAAVDTASTTGP